MLAAVTAACGTPPPPLPGWIAPKVVTAALSNSTITAGETFTVTGSASDDTAVTRLELHFSVRTKGQVLVPCTNTPWESAALVSVEFTCTMPAIAPNGNWTVGFVVGDDRFGYGPEGICYCAGKAFQFTVAGGTEDTAPPHLDSATVSPNPAPVGTPLVVTIRVSDDHPTSRPQPLYTNYNGSQIHTCTQTADSAITPTQHEYTYSCPPETAAGDYEGLVHLTDEMGFEAYGGVQYQIVDPTP